MNVLVTGGSGHLGCALQDALQARGHSYTVTDRRRVLLHRRRAAWAPVDVRHVHPLVHLVRRRGPFDAVVHLAGLADVPACEADPGLCESLHVEGTRSLVKAMRRTGTARVVYASSVHVYGDTGAAPAAEDAPCRPGSRYALAVRHAECDLFEAAYRDGTGAAVLRLSSCVGGPHEPGHRLVPTLLACLREGRPFRLQGACHATPDGTAVRDHLCVRDAADAILCVLEANAGGTFNVCSGAGVSVRQAVRLAERVSGRTLAVAEEDARPGDPAVCLADPGRIGRELGWKASRTLEDVLAEGWSG